MEIEIDIPDPVAYAKVARILDQPEFMNRVIAIRKSWGLTQLVQHNFFEDWLREPQIDLVLTPEAAQALQSATERFDTDTTHNNMSSYEEYDKNKQLSEVRVIEYELEYTLRKLNLDLEFKQILLKAIVCNKVKAEDLVKDKNAKESLYEDWLLDDPYYGDKSKIAASQDTKPNIARDREWYWLHKSGKSYLQIAKEAKDRGPIPPNLYRSNIVTQVKRYEQFLCINI